MYTSTPGLNFQQSFFDFFFLFLFRDLATASHLQNVIPAPLVENVILEVFSVYFLRLLDLLWGHNLSCRGGKGGGGRRGGEWGRKEGIKQRDMKVGREMSEKHAIKLEASRACRQGVFVRRRHAQQTRQPAEPLFHFGFDLFLTRNFSVVFWFGFWRADKQ